jgi:hypothetical protein
MPDRVLTERDLNRALLARQLLLKRGGGSLPQTLERVAGLQAQYAPSMYIGLAARLEGFERDQLTRALERRSVVQGTLLRTTVHLVSARDYWPFALAVRRRRRESWLRSHRDAPSSATRAASAKRLRARLRGGPMRRSEIQELLSSDSSWTNGVGLWLDLVRVPPSGTWEQRRADLYAAAEGWLGPADTTAEAGVELLVRRYLAGFGPARPTDVADWAGLPVGEISSALDRIRLRRFRDEDGQELVDLPRAPLPDPETPAPVRLLPVWDATLLVHARRTGILPERFRTRVFNPRTPHSVHTFLVDGAVAGTWSFEGGRLRLEPFGRLDPATRRELNAEGERIAALHR